MIMFEQDSEEKRRHCMRKVTLEYCDKNVRSSERSMKAKNYFTHDMLKVI